MVKKTVQMDLPDQEESIPVSFEVALAELETLVEAMNGQDTGLEQLLADYQRGAKLVKFCRERLAFVRQEVARIETGLDVDVSRGE